MRSSLVLLALAAIITFAAAQNSTSDGSSEPGIAECVVTCREQAIVQDAGAGQKCIDGKTGEDRVACICRSDQLVGALQSCLTSTCPTYAGQINLENECKQFNGAGSGKVVGMLPVLTASGAMALGALFL